MKNLYKLADLKTALATRLSITMLIYQQHSHKTLKQIEKTGQETRFSEKQSFLNSFSTFNPKRPGHFCNFSKTF